MLGTKSFWGLSCLGVSKFLLVSKFRPVYFSPRFTVSRFYCLNISL
ncbi:MAG: hypothetical protein ACI95C_001795 [Pseudohongiellaceae bacterium]|jgi:hypothetical protein